MRTRGRPKTGMLLGLALLLVAGQVWADGPPTAFSASGVFVPGGPAWTIDAGSVNPAGSSGRFVVKDRTITGFLSGDIVGPFGFTFGTNVPLSQSGQIHGTLVTGPYEAKVHATSELVLGPGLAFGGPSGPVLVAGLHVTGTLTFTAGTQGHGGFDAFFTVALDPVTFHIVDVVATGFPVFGEGGVFLGTTTTQATLFGQWHQ